MLITESDTLHGDSMQAYPSFTACLLPQNDTAADSVTLLTAESAVGFEADPVPYATRHDGVILGILFTLFVLYLLIYVRAGAFMQRQAKAFFRVGNERVTTVPDLPSELRFGRLVWVVAVVEWGLMAYFYMKAVAGVQTLTLTHYMTLALLMAFFAVYLCLRQALHRGVNWIFFDGKKIEQWNKSRLALLALECLLLLPVVVVAPFVDVPMPEGVYYVLIIIFFVKILSFYKTYFIFFRRFGAVLQIFLYFCALELIPLAAVGGFLVWMREYLQINF